MVTVAVPDGRREEPDAEMEHGDQGDGRDADPQEGDGIGMDELGRDLVARREAVAPFVSNPRTSARSVGVMASGPISPCASHSPRAAMPPHSCGRSARGDSRKDWPTSTTSDRQAARIGLFARCPSCYADNRE